MGLSRPGEGRGGLETVGAAVAVEAAALLSAALRPQQLELIDALVADRPWAASPPVCWKRTNT